MSIILSFIKISSKDKKVAMESFFWVIWIRIMLWLFPFTKVQRRVEKRVSQYYNVSNPIFYKSKLRIMIMVASKYVPRATCLVQALAGYILFSKHGYNTSIKIGVLTENGEFEAHAWLEHDEKVVLGESEKNFTTILGID